MLRTISVSIRNLQARKETKRTIATFQKWQQEVSTLPPNTNPSKKILLIRLDDIGDYLLFRNSLAAYKTSPRWQYHEITLLGNIAWRDIYNYTDASCAHNTIWVNKNEYFDNENTRKALWQQLRAEGFDTVICSAHTRPLQLDDLCMLATGAPTRIASANTFASTTINQLSDKLYTSLYNNTELMHEFFFNQHFTNWCCGTALSLARPYIAPPDNIATEPSPYILCFIGASKKSRQWPAPQWIQLIQQIGKDNKYKVIIAGGKGDKEMADTITAATNAQSIAGNVTLVEMAGWAANAVAVLTNNTMAAHLAPSCNTPTLIITNGDNFYNFTAYKEAGITGVDTLYPAHFLKTWKARNHQLFPHYIAVTKDIATIPPAEVFEALTKLLANKQPS